MLSSARWGFSQANLVNIIFNYCTEINFHCLQKNPICGFQRMLKAESGSAQVSMPFMSSYVPESFTDMGRGQERQCVPKLQWCLVLHHP